MIANIPDEEKEVLYPADRRQYIGLKAGTWVVIGILIIIFIGVPWLQYLVFGLPPDPSASFPPLTPGDPTGFPAWISVTHWVNFLFLTLIIRSGLSILFDHPRLYWNDGCYPASEWIRFTPLKVPRDRLWTAKDDARYISPLLGLPGFRHTVGLARLWHFLVVPFFILNGAVFIVLLFSTNQWQRLVPTTWQILPDAWNVLVHYVTFNFPIEPNGFYHYNALQQLAYFSVVFILAPLNILTGLAMSPAIGNRLHWYPKLFGGRQNARSIHFLVMISYVGFVIIHVALVAATGLKRNMNHITLGTDDPDNPLGLYIGIAIVLAVIAACFIAYWLAWHKPRAGQRVQRALNENLWRASINLFKPRPHFKKEDISPYFWANGKLPTSEKYKKLLENDFKDYRLKIGGLVANPVELSMDDIKKMRMERNITMHHCIQGWTGVAEWGGVPLRDIVELVKPFYNVKTVAFFSFGEGLFGGVYYDTHTLDNCMKPQSLLAWEMNYKPLSEVHGAPLRIRIENQLGYKMVKWIESIEFVESHKNVGKGFGGKNADDEYFDLVANT